MKKITKKLAFLTTLLLVSYGYAQKVAVIGMNHVGQDGFTFVAAQDLPSGEVIYFTENEYNDASNAFVDQTEAVVVFTSTVAIPKGNVVFINESTVTADTFIVSSTIGVCGTAVKTGTSLNFAVATGGDSIYAYSDTDSNPTNGITTIHAVMYTGFNEGASTITGGNIVVAQDPIPDFPTAIVVDGFGTTAPDRTEFKTLLADRNNINRAGLENIANYVNAQTNVALSTTFFTNLDMTVLSSPSFALTTNVKLYPVPSHGALNIISEENDDFQIVNGLGQVVKTFTVKANLMTTVGIEELIEGTYFVKSITNARKIAQQFVVKN
jgi:Secretion system C-terminal sorting domain